MSHPRDQALPIRPSAMIALPRRCYERCRARRKPVTGPMLMEGDNSIISRREKFRRVSHIGDLVAVEEQLDGPYVPSDPRIPTGLTQEEGLFYEGLIQVLNEREKREEKDGIDRKPHIVTITDLAKDYDDLMAIMCLKEFDRMGIIQLEGFVANLMPAERRALFGRGALDSLGLPKMPIGIGTVGDAQRQLNNYTHEFNNTEGFIAPADTKLPDGQDLLTKIFTERPTEKKKLTVLTISSLMDIARFSKEHTKLLKNGIANVFDLEGAATFHQFMQDYDIPSTAWTKVAANATPIYSSLFEFLDETDHPLGYYLRGVQTSQELNFYARCCSIHPFAPHMTQDWAVVGNISVLDVGARCRSSTVGAPTVVLDPPSIPVNRLNIPGLRDVAVKNYSDWQQSNVGNEALKVEFQKACDVALADDLDLEQIHGDQDPDFFIKNGVKRGIARRFVGDIEPWAKRHKRGETEE
ncbi:hypothetical protein IFR05_017033 [Cadophora sp. M221]|nr:hypothetical protein IFR05_017033 [Cadophora sp. M221]